MGNVYHECYLQAMAGHGHNTAAGSLSWDCLLDYTCYLDIQLSRYAHIDLAFKEL